MLAMTLMVRDEADIIRPMIEHSLAQGIDLIIVTDNGSVDGTTEILEEFTGTGQLVLRHDPVHMKQQYSTVTKMARDAASEYHADWVINADADEFWQPVADGRTLAEVFARLSPDYRAIEVPVFDMTGAPALSGTGLQRLLYRDLRPVEDLRRIGLLAHATPDTVHVGDPDVEVAQGNHYVNFEPQGEPAEELRVEVQHFPWRSWAQFERKVIASGRAYESNATLLPSPNHHGMKEYSRYKLGSLFAAYITRHPDQAELTAGIAAGHFVLDERIARTRTSPVPDVPVDPSVIEVSSALGRIIFGYETTTLDDARRIQQLEADVAGARAELGRQRARRVVRAADWIHELRPGRAH